MPTIYADLRFAARCGERDKKGKIKMERKVKMYNPIIPDFNAAKCLVPAPGVPLKCWVDSLAARITAEHELEAVKGKVAAQIPVVQREFDRFLNGDVRAAIDEAYAAVVAVDAENANGTRALRVKWRKWTPWRG